jgi:hypothetical protein
MKRFKKKKNHTLSRLSGNFSKTQIQLFVVSFARKAKKGLLPKTKNLFIAIIATVYCELIAAISLAVHSMVILRWVEDL